MADASEMKSTKVDLDKFKVSLTDFKKTSKKAIEGGCAKVFFCTQISTQQNVVMKQTDIKKKRVKNPLKLFCQEIEVLCLCKHRAIIRFVGWSLEESKGKISKANIFLEAASKGSLESLIKKCVDGNRDPLFDDTHKLIIAYGVASAMKYLHGMNYLHRDLKCDNILLDDELHPYVTDFGTSKQADDVKTSQTVQQTTPTIMPPEFFDNYEKFNRTKPIDVFSYAMVLYKIITELEPYPGATPLDIVDKTTKGFRPEFPEENSPDEKWKKLICDCWDQGPEARPTFDRICDLLESPQFVTPEINADLFNTYKNEIEDFFNGSSQNSAKSSQPSKFDINQIKKAADEGNADAQNSYALHLYNGLSVKQDRDAARQYFELAANNGNHDAEFFFSLILAREGDSDRSTEYYQKSIDAQLPEAYSNYAQQLIATNDPNNIAASTQYLQLALQRGSISAMLSYANICDANAQYGNPAIFYEMASNCCHCFDSVGFYFPVDYKVFRCHKCNIDICEGCAKYCHKNHQTVEIGTNHSFVCGCGTNHFNEGKKKHCSIEYVGEMLCDGQPVCNQHLYQCLDCNNKSEGKFICHSCAENCHKGHKVIDCGIQKGFCSCGASQLDNKGKCKLTYFLPSDPKVCSCSTNRQAQRQRWFQCMSCGLYGDESQGICMSCAHRCHQGHLLLDRGVQLRKCQCKDVDSNPCQLRH